MSVVISMACVLLVLREMICVCIMKRKVILRRRNILLNHQCACQYYPNVRNMAIIICNINESNENIQ